MVCLDAILVEGAPFPTSTSEALANWRFELSYRDNLEKTGTKDGLYRSFF